MALGAAWAAWAAGSTQHGLVAHWGGELSVTFRPLLFWLILGWPTGRIGRGDRRWVAVFAAISLLTWVVVRDLFRPTLWPDETHNPLMIVQLRLMSDALFSLGTSVLLPVSAIVLVVAVARRYGRTPTVARRSARPALVAAVVAAAGDLVLVASDYLGAVTSNVRGSTWLGGVGTAIDFLRFAIVPAIFVYAAWRSRVFTPPTRVGTLDIGPVRRTLRLQESVALAVGDPSAVVAFRDSGRGWIDLEGHHVDLDGPTRSVTIVERDGEPIAAVACDVASGDRPVAIETAVAAAGLAVECERLEAEARTRTREAMRARRTVIEVEDAARRQLERDLHDGAQQRLVGLALQARLAAGDIATKDGDDATTILTEGITAARGELRDVVAGLMPAVLAQRGLGAALTTMAATTPMAVSVDVHYPADVPTSVATTAWFAVAEAVANAVKHSGGTRLRITGAVDERTLWAVVADDGCGGADPAAGSGLSSLRDRVNRAGGRLAITSASATGTEVRVELPVDGALS